MIILSFIANGYDQIFVLANQKRVIFELNVRRVAKYFRQFRVIFNLFYCAKLQKRC